MVWPSQKNVRAEKENRTSKKNVNGRSTSSHDNRKCRTRSVEKKRGMAFGLWKMTTAVIKPEDRYFAHACGISLPIPFHNYNQAVYYSFHYPIVQFLILINKRDVLSHIPDCLIIYGLRDVMISSFTQTVLCTVWWLQLCFYLICKFALFHVPFYPIH
jgi:hypothetical protein